MTTPLTRRYWRRYLVRENQEYEVVFDAAMLADPDCFDELGYPLPGFDQYACEQGTLLSQETSLIDDDELEYGFTDDSGEAPDGR